MKLQAAFDDVTGERCLEIVESCYEDLDIIETGTLLIINEGLSPIKKLRELYPKAKLLADPKIMDAPEKIARKCYEAGADIVTVMTVSGEKVMKKVIDAAKEYGKEVFADLLHSKEPLKDAILADSLGADYICVHSSTEESKDSLDELRSIKAVVRHAKIAVAGGIGPDTADRFKGSGADIVIAGSSITTAKDPKEAVRLLKEKIK